jgi:hypothetical protein
MPGRESRASPLPLSWLVLRAAIFDLRNKPMPTVYGTSVLRSGRRAASSETVKERSLNLAFRWAAASAARKKKGRTRGKLRP